MWPSGWNCLDVLHFPTWNLMSPGATTQHMMEEKKGRRKETEENRRNKERQSWEGVGEEGGQRKKFTFWLEQINASCYSGPLTYWAADWNYHENILMTSQAHLDCSEVTPLKYWGTFCLLLWDGMNRLSYSAVHFHTLPVEAPAYARGGSRAVSEQLLEVTCWSCQEKRLRSWWCFRFGLVGWLVGWSVLPSAGRNHQSPATWTAVVCVAPAASTHCPQLLVEKLHKSSTFTWSQGDLWHLWKFETGFYKKLWIRMGSFCPLNPAECGPPLPPWSSNVITVNPTTNEIE